MSQADTNSEHLVLVVDDNTVIRELVTRQLAKLGIGAETAVNGTEAVEKVTSGDKQYDAVLMDVQMPEMDGLTATQKIREHEAQAGSKTIIIALTGHGSRVECLAAGMDDFIAKPMNIATLKAMLQRWIPGLKVESV